MKYEKDYLVLSGDGIFESVQGEGASMGCPAVFIRLQGCNLKCSWCDTKYTWTENQENTEKVKVDEIVERLKKYNARRLVITGGEPLLQMESVEELIKKLPGWKFEMETNGTIIPGDKIIDLVQFNISPKLKNSGNIEKLRFRPEVLKKLALKNNTYFKFVAGEVADLKEIKEIVETCNIPDEKVIVMAEGIESEEIRQKMLLIIDEVKKNNWRILPRLHVYLWGNRRKI